VHLVLSSARPTTSTQQPANRAGRVSLYGAIVGLVLACNNVDRTQVMRLLELVDSVEEDTFGTLLAFISYQAGRRRDRGREYIPIEAARVVIDCLLRLRDELGSIERNELLRCFSMAKWTYTAISQAFRNVCQHLNIRSIRSCTDILSRFNSVEEVIRTIVASQR